MIRGIIGGSIGAVIGALIWAAISYFTNYEVGIVAWGIGALVGVGASAMSRDAGGGAAMGLVCCVLALVAIFGGKWLALKAMTNDIADELISAVEGEATSVERYNEIKGEIEELKAAASREDYRVFMVNNEYTDETEPQNIPEEELTWFETEVIPDLFEFHQNQPAYEDWAQKEKAKLQEFRQEVSSQFSVSQGVFSSLNLFDILWIILGIGSAFKFGSGMGD